MMSGYEFSLQSQDFLGIVYGLMGALFYSLVTVMAKSFQGLDSVHLVIAQMAVASLFFLPSFIEARPVFTTVSVLCLLTMGVLHSAIALGLYFAGVKKIKVQHTSVLSYVDPVSALIFAFFIFGEVPTLYTALGGGLALLASYVILAKK